MLKEKIPLEIDDQCYVAPCTLIEERTIQHLEDATGSLDISFWQLDIYGELVFAYRNRPIVTGWSIPYDLDSALLQLVREEITGLPATDYELFPVDHNVEEGFHRPDRIGNATRLLEDLEAHIEISRPPFNHNKVSSKKVDKYDLSELHFDSFEGMRCDEYHQRQVIFRHFLNLDHRPRTTVFCPHNPDETNSLVPIEYNPTMLNSFYDHHSRRLPLVLVTIPPPKNGRVYGIKLPTTHILHGEYGPKNDLLAIVNSLK